MEKEKNECCPRFDPILWNDKTFEWNNKRFIKDKVYSMMYVPLNFGAVMTRVGNLADASKASSSDGMCLTHHRSGWVMDIYYAVDKEVPGADNVVMNGKFYCKAYEGPFKDTGKWHNDFENTAKQKGLALQNTFIWYTTCPKCAKKYGKNGVAFFGELK